ncbi:hydroxyacid dehydrogenase [Jiangella gansuensis]|uniref:hydroxyacid dehydrogenase n=1 Tax=Jiangella gansuensis TaxID=281473 RepID=UPI0004AE6744|nr:hydroxyacid dehydrogenase [Jiangella gansuensis]
MTDLKVYVAIRPDEFDTLYSPQAQDRLRSLAAVDVAAGDGRAVLPADVAAGYDVIVTSWSTAPFDPRTVRGPRLRLAAHTAGSVRGLFPRAMLENGLRVTQGGAAAMAPAVAELAVTLTLALLRNLHRHDRELWTSRDWATARQPVLGRSLAERRVGVVGLSRVGWRYVSMVRGLGVETVHAYDPYADPTAAADAGVELAGLDDLFATCDVVAVHAPSTDETRHLVGARQLAALADGSILVNTARSWSVDQDALLREVRSGRILAGLDVFDEEPLPADSGFLGLPNVIVTPHVAGGTVEARRQQGAIVVDELARFAAGDALLHEVTLGAYDRLA